MRKDSFEVFHYRQPRPAGVEVHHHDFYEVYFLIGGEVEYWVDGRILKMAPGDLLLINPMELHRPVADAQNGLYERIVLWIDKEYLESHAGLSRCFDVTHPGHSHLLHPTAAERPGLTERMGSLVREFYSRDLGAEQAAYGLFLQLMVQINRIALRADSQQEESRQLSGTVQAAISYIAENLSQPMTLESVAEQVYVSKYHLSHAFSREVGVSVYRYITLRRLMMARQQLAEGEPAGQVCRNCGFADYTSFYRAFKSEYGISPREFA
jgi:AraC-like DNA-binding protein